MSAITGARVVGGVTTKFETLANAEGLEHNKTLLRLFRALPSGAQLTECAVERSTLETEFLKVIRENQVAEEDAGFLGWIS